MKNSSICIWFVIVWLAIIAVVLTVKSAAALPLEPLEMAKSRVEKYTDYQTGCEYLIFYDKTSQTRMNQYGRPMCRETKKP